MYDIYTRPNCVWCVRAKDLLSRRGIEFNDLDITNDELRNNEYNIAVITPAHSKILLFIKVF